MVISTDKQKIQEVLTRSIAKIYPTPAALEKELLSGRRLRIYLGIDPTSPHLHLGHAVSLLVLRRIQELGHEIILLVGDFTARIGDPTDKLSPRQPMTTAEIEVNTKTFKEQAAKLIAFDGENPARLEHNGTWYEHMTFGEIIRLAQNFTVQQMIERDMFQERLVAGKPIGVHEFLYPLMQGYDSVAMDVDAEIGGNDQIFNMLAGRTLLKTLKNKEKIVIATKLLVDASSGRKLSKTEGSLVNLDDAPTTMFGKVMAMPDEMIGSVAELSTFMPIDGVKTLTKEDNFRDAKLRVAREVVRTYHSTKEADRAQVEWLRTFSKKEVPEEIEVKLVSPSLFSSGTTAVVAELGGISKSEAMRLITQGAVEANEKTVRDPKKQELKDGDVVKIGKKKFFRIKLK